MKKDDTTVLNIREDKDTVSKDLDSGTQVLKKPLIAALEKQAGDKYEFR